MGLQSPKLASAVRAFYGAARVRAEVTDRGGELTSARPFQQGLESVEPSANKGTELTGEAGQARVLELYHSVRVRHKLPKRLRASTS